jgi:exodeoxyribonuclease VII small subunit
VQGGAVNVARNREGKAFEKKLEQLEKIISQLESGDATLEDSLKLFEDGTSMLKELSGILEEAEKKVEVLSRDASGAVTTEAFDPEDMDEEEDQE